MDSAHLFLMMMTSVCTGDCITRHVERRRKLTPAEAGVLMLGPYLLTPALQFVLVLSGFNAWYRQGDPFSGREVCGTFILLAASLAAIGLAWLACSAAARKR